MAKRFTTSHQVSHIVTVTKQVLKWGFESERITKIPDYGPDFKVASLKQRRLERAKNGKKLFSREQIRELIDAADAKWTAMILLAINGGMGNSDIGELKLSDVGGEWLEFPRGKTGIDRRIPLWPETRAAIDEAIAARRKPKDEAADLLFLSEHGGPLVKVEKTKTDLIVQGFKRLLEEAGARDKDGKPKGIYQERMGFYWLRHTFQTIGDGAKDPVATAAIMGHIDGSMAGHYREDIEDKRPRAVTDHVRD